MMSQRIRAAAGSVSPGHEQKQEHSVSLYGKHEGNESLVTTASQLSEPPDHVLSAIMVKAATGSAHTLNKAPQVLGVERCLAPCLTAALKEHFVRPPHTHRTCLCCGNSPTLSHG